jgi:hypothetical protein
VDELGTGNARQESRGAKAKQGSIKRARKRSRLSKVGRVSGISRFSRFSRSSRVGRVGRVSRVSRVSRIDCLELDLFGGVMQVVVAPHTQVPVC